MTEQERVRQQTRAKSDVVQRDGSILKGETVAAHTEKVVAQLQHIFALYPDAFTSTEKQLAQLACEYHDLGKLNALFQEKAKNGWRTIEGEIPHGVLSCLFLDLKALTLKGYTTLEQKALVSSIYYHHTRSTLLNMPDLRTYINRYLVNEAKAYFGPAVVLSPKNVNYRIFKLDPNMQRRYNYEGWLLYVTLKGLLNKADYAASNSKDLPIEMPHPKKEAEQLPTLVKVHLQRLADEKGVPLVMYEAQRFLAAHSGQNVVLVAPAGSGKTEGALLWLGNQKGFYTLPFKVSATAMYDRIRHTCQFEPVGLIHSDALSYHLEEQAHESEAEATRRYDIMKGLAYPLTVCTVDQLFKFVFKALGTELYAATLKYSCVIIDEIQLYTPKLMAFLCYGLKLVNALGGKFLIMTATLPQMVTHYLEQEGIPFEAGRYQEHKSGIRHRIQLCSDVFDYSLILSQATTQKVLVLCNTVKQAQVVYQTLRESLVAQGATTDISLQLLHAKFTKAHRAQLESSLLTFAKGGSEATGIWVATQIVEASLDLDFDVLHTEMCSADSLFQRMGRCHRVRTYNETTANVYVYNTGNGKAKRTKTGEIRGIYDVDLYESSWTELQPFQGCLLSEADKAMILERVFDLERLANSSYLMQFNQALESLEGITPGMMSKSEAAALFRDIRSVYVVPDSVYNTHQAAIDEGLAACGDTSLSRQAHYNYREQVLEHCVSLNLFKERGFPLGVDRAPLRCQDRHLAIHRARLVYEFDDVTLTGRGLLMGEIEEDDQFINSVRTPVTSVMG